MKALKLLATIGLILVANAAIADTPSASNAAVTGTTGAAGTSVVVATGSNGYFQETVSAGSTGTVSEIEDVDDVYYVMLLCVAGYNGTYTSGCTVVIPEGMTGTATYSLNRQLYNGSYTGTAKIKVGSTTYTTSSTSSGTITLSPGTYALSSSASISGNIGGTVQAVFQLDIDEDE